MSSTLAADDEGIDITAGIVNFDNTVTTTNAGVLTVTNSGLLTTLAGVTLDGAFTQDGAGGVSLGGGIQTSADDIDFAGAVTLTADAHLDSGGLGAGTGDITFGGSATLDGNFLLSATAGTSTLTFGAAVGGTTPLSGLLVNSAGDVTLNDLWTTNAIDVTASGDIQLAALDAGTTISLVTSGGSINDADDDNISNLNAAGLITLTALNEIGGGAAPAVVDSAGALEIADGNTVNASVTGAGQISLAGLGSLSLADVDTVNGAIEVTASDTIVATDVVAGGGSSVSLTTVSAGDINVGIVDAGTGDVTISSVASIDELAGDAGSDDIDISGAIVTLIAATGIGESGNPEIAASTSLAIDNTNTTTTSHVDVRIIGDVTLDGTIRNQSPGGALTIESVDGSLNTGDDLVEVNGGDLTLSATDTSGGTNTSPSTVTINTGGLSSGGGTITIESADDVIVTGAVDAGVGDVSITADNASDDFENDDAGEIDGSGTITAGGTVTLRASSGIGNNNALTTDSDRLRVRNEDTNTATGSIHINAGNSGAIEVVLQELIQEGPGSVQIVANANAISVNDSGLDDDGLAISVSGGGSLTVAVGAGDTSTPDLDLTVEDSIVSNGAVTLQADDAIFFAAVDGDVTADGAGSVTILADADNVAGDDGGFLSMLDGVVIDAGSGVLDLDARGDITVSQIATTNGSGAAISVISSQGAVLDGGDTDATVGGLGSADIIARNVGAVVELTAADGIGASDAIDTDILELNANVTGSGTLAISEADTITLSALNNANGSITVIAGGTITAVDVRTSDTDSDANDISLTTTSGDISIDTIISTGGSAGDVLLNAAGAITDATGVDTIVDIVADQVSFQTGSGGVGVDANGDIDTDAATVAASVLGGGIDIRDVGDGVIVGTVTDSGVVGISADTDGIEVTADSPLTINDAIVNSGGGDITLAAEGALGSDDLTVDADITASGGAGSISLYAGDSILVGSAQAVSISTEGAGTISIHAGRDYSAGAVVNGNADGDVILGDFVGNSISSSSGSVEINATDGVSMGAAASITSVSGGVSVTADSDSGGLASGNNGETITMSDGATIDAGSGDITIAATGSVTLGALSTSSANATAISVTTGDEVIDAGSAGLELTAINGTVDLNAVNGIGDSGGATDTDIEITADTINADSTNGTINIDSINANAVTVSSLTTGVGNITFEQSGGGDISFASVSTGDGTIYLRAIASNLTVNSVSSGNDNLIDLITTSGDLLVDGTVNAGAGTVALNVNGRIDDAPGDDTTIDVIAGTLAVSNSSGIGSTIDDGLNVNVNVMTIANGGGDAFMTEADGFAAGVIDQGTGNLTLDVGGALTDNDAGATNNITATTLVITGNNDVTSIETNITNLQLTTAATSLNEADEINLNASTISSTLSLTTAGEVTQSGTLDVTGAMTVNSGDSDITLSNASNVFTGTVTFNGLTSASNLHIVDMTALDLQSGLSVNNLTVNAAGITQSGPLTAAGTTTLVAVGNTITLAHGSNDFQGEVIISSATNATLVDSNGITLGGPSTVTGLYDVTADGITLSGAVSAGSVDFDVDAGVGSITDGGSGSLAVTGTTSLIALPSDDVTLDNAGNEFGTVTIGAARNVTLAEDDTSAQVGIDLGASVISGTLSVTTERGITQSGVVSVVGATTLTAGGTVVGTNDIDLSTAGNNFSSVTIVNAGDATLADTNSLSVDDATVGGHYAVTVGNGIDVTGNVVAGSLNFDASSGAGNIIDSTGDLTVTGLAVFEAQTADDVILNAVTNDFASVSVGTSNAVNNVTLRDEDGIALQEVTALGTLMVTAAAGISSTGTANQTVVVAGTTTLTAGAGDDITLDKVNNDFATVAVTQARDATLVDVDNIILGAITLGNDLIVDASGIDVAGAVNALTATLDATGGNLTDSTGSLSLSSGDSTFTVTGANVITLNGANDFDRVILNGGSGAVTLNDTTGITVGASSMTGLLDITAQGIVIDAVVTAGSSDLDGSGGDLTDTASGELNVAGNSVLTVTGGAARACAVCACNFIGEHSV